MDLNVREDLTKHDRIILERLFNPNLPYSDVVDEKNALPEDEEPETESVLEAKRLEVEGVKAAEEGDVLLALDYFNKAVNLEPQRASGYNNRAQALRLVNDNSGALEDLTKALELSHGQGKAACQAYIQRGLLRKLNGEDADAIEDFKKASNLGSPFAKQMVITLNPYAALCNQMMTEMIQKEQLGGASS